MESKMKLSLEKAIQQIQQGATEINLSYKNLNDEDILILTTALNKNRTLTILDLSSNQIGIVGAASLAELVEKNYALAFLDLEYNNIGREGKKYLREIKARCQENYRLHEKILMAALAGDISQLAHWHQHIALTSIRDRKSGNTCLHAAACGSSPEVIDWLIKSVHFDIHVQNKNGDTPLHKAVAAKNWNIAAYLLKLGASPDLRNNRSRPALLQKRELWPEELRAQAVV